MIKRLEFRKIPSLKSLYEISEDGRVLRNVYSGKRRKFYRNDSGYLCVNVTIGDFKKTLYVAALVAECWLGIKPKGFLIDHIDRDKCNNHFQNLRYVSPSTNCRNKAGYARVSVALSTQKDLWIFETMSQAARFISRKKQKSVRCCMRKLCGRKQNIYDYKVTYNGEQITYPQPIKTIQISLFGELI